MTTYHMNYVNPTDRVATACIAAVRPWIAKFESDLIALESRANPTSRTSDLVVRLARQSANQGLVPADLDNEVGTAALAAIADAIFSGKKKVTLYAALPAEWKHVVSAAQRIVDRERGRR